MRVKSRSDEDSPTFYVVVLLALIAMLCCIGYVIAQGSNPEQADTASQPPE